jgi:Spy/CpxP family protein refolding chaperone
MVLGFLLAAFGVGAAAEEAAPAAPAATQIAPENLPAWMSPQVINAAVQINMNEAQQAQFRQIVGDYVTRHYAMIQQEAKKGAPNLDMTIKSKDKALVHKMDDEMHKVLTPEQYPAYDNYKKVLRAGLQP